MAVGWDIDAGMGVRFGPEVGMVRLRTKVWESAVVIRTATA